MVIVYSTRYNGAVFSRHFTIDPSLLFIIIPSGKGGEERRRGKAERASSSDVNIIQKRPNTVCSPRIRCLLVGEAGPGLLENLGRQLAFLLLID